MATVGDIAITIGADIGPMVRELGKGKGALNDFGSSGSRMGGILGSAMGKVAVGVGVAATAIIALTKASMSNIDALSKQARALGISVASFQSMAMVAEEAGVESDKLSKILIRMQDSITSLGSGTKAQVATFQALGLSMADLAGMGADEQFALIAERLAGMTTPAERTAAALDIFGKAGADAITMFDGYGAAVANATDFQEKFGIAVRDVDAQQIEAANDAMGRLGMVASGLGNVLAVALAPAVETVADALANMIGAMIGAEETGLKFFNTISNYQAVMEKFGSVNAAAALAGGWAELEAILSQSDAIGILEDMAYNYDVLQNTANRATSAMAGDLQALAEEYPVLASALQSMSSNVDELAAKLEAALDAGDVEAAQRYSEELGIAVENLRKAVEGADALSGLDLSGAVSWADSLTAAFGRVADAAWAAANAGSLGMTEGTPLSGDVSGLMPPSVGGVTTSPRPPGAPPLLNEPAASKGGGGGGGGNARIEALISSLQTETEIIAAWYEESLAALQAASDAELAALGGKHEAMERLEDEHQKRLATIREMGSQWGVEAALSGGAQILGAMGQINKKALKLSKAFAAAEALVSTYQGAAKELQKGTFGFAQAAAVIAKGMGFVAAIRGVSDGGAVAGAGGRGGAGATQTAAPSAPPVQRVLIDYRGPEAAFPSFASLVDMMNAAGKAGYTLNAQITGAR